MARRWPSGSWPAAWARADSTSAYMVVAWTRPWSRSTGWVPMSGSSGGQVSGQPGDDGQSSSTPALRARRRVARASAPAMSTRGRAPEATRSAARLTSHWGMFPPMPEQRVSAPSIPRRPARAGAGSPWRSDREWTIQRWLMSATAALPASARARAVACAIRSKGDGAAAGSCSRLVTWPAPTTTGTLVQSVTVRRSSVPGGEVAGSDGGGDENRVRRPRVVAEDRGWLVFGERQVSRARCCRGRRRTPACARAWDSGPSARCRRRWPRPAGRRPCTSPGAGR